MNIKTKRAKAQQGFSLVEMSVVIAIMAVIATFGLDMTATFMQRAAHSNTHAELDDIKRALTKFVEEEDRLPCPADPTIAHTALTFGAEQAACSGGAVVTATGGANNALIGAVPIRALNLPLGYMADAWDRKYSYAVTPALTTVPGYSGNTGALVVVAGRYGVTGAVNNYYELTDTPASVAWVIVSHGMDGKGAYPFRGTSLEIDCIPAPTASFNMMPDNDNCDHHSAAPASRDHVFFDTNYNTGEVENVYFDDIVRWDIKR